MRKMSIYKNITIILLSAAILLTILQLISKLLLLSALSFIIWLLFIIQILIYLLELIKVRLPKPVSVKLKNFHKNRGYKILLKNRIIDEHHLLPFVQVKCFDDLLTNVKKGRNVILISDTGWGKTKLIVELLNELSNDGTFSKKYKKVIFWRGEPNIPVGRNLYIFENIGININEFLKLAVELESRGGIFIATIYPEEIYDRYKWIQNKINYIPIDAYPTRDEWKKIIKIILKDLKDRGLNVTGIEQIIDKFSGNLIPPFQMYYSLSRIIEKGIDITTEDQLHRVVEVDYGERKDIEEKIKVDFSESLLYAIRLLTWLTNKNYVEEEITKIVYTEFLKKEKHQYDVALNTLSGSDIHYIIKKVGRKIYIPDYHLNRLEKYWNLREYINELYKLTEFLDKKIRAQRKSEFWIGLGDRFAEIKNYDKALEVYKEALNKTHNTEKKGMIYIKIGDIYLDAQCYEEAHQNYNTAIELFESIKEPTHSASYYLANAYEKKGDTINTDDLNKRMEIYKRALDIYNTVSKVDFARLSLKIAKILEEEFFKTNGKRRELLEKSLEYAKNAKEQYSELNNPDGIAEAFIIIGICLSLMDISSNKNISEKALSYFKNALDCVDKVIDKIRKIDLYFEIGERCFGLYTSVIPTKFSITMEENPILEISMEAYKKSLNTANYVLENKEYFIRILKIREDTYRRMMYIISQKLGDVCTSKGDFENALNYYNDILRVLKVMNAQEEIGDIYIKIGYNVYFRNDKYDKAVEALAKAEEIFSLMDNKMALANVYMMILHVYLDWKKYNNAKPYVKKLNGIINAVEDLLTKAASYLRMGEVSRHLNRYEEAETYYKNAEKCLMVYPQKENTYYSRLLASLYSNFGDLYLTRKSPDKAEEYLIKCYELYLKLPNEIYNAGVSAMGLGRLYRIKGDLKKSNEFFEKALRIFIKDKKSNAAKCLLNLGINYMILDNYQEAKEKLQKALELSEHPSVQLEVNMVLSRVHHKLKDYNKSKRNLDEALRIWKEYYSDNIFIQLNIIEQLGDLYFDQGNYDAARKFYEDYIKIFREKIGEKELPHILKLAELYEKIGKTYYIEQKEEKGSELYKIARDYWFKAEDLVKNEEVETKLHIIKNIIELSRILEDWDIIENYRNKMKNLLPQPVPIIQYKFPLQRFKTVPVKKQCILCGSNENIKECPESHIIYCKRCCKEEIKCELYERCWETE